MFNSDNHVSVELNRTFVWLSTEMLLRDLWSCLRDYSNCSVFGCANVVILNTFVLQLLIVCAV